MTNFLLFVREYRGIEIRFWWSSEVERFRYSWKHNSSWDYSYAEDLAEIRADAVLSVDRMIARNRSRQRVIFRGSK